MLRNILFYNVKFKEGQIYKKYELMIPCFVDPMVDFKKNNIHFSLMGGNTK
jgi:hypothetical protein